MDEVRRREIRKHVRHRGLYARITVLKGNAQNSVGETLVDNGIHIFGRFQQFFQDPQRQQGDFGGRMHHTLQKRGNQRSCDPTILNGRHQKDLERVHDLDLRDETLFGVSTIEKADWTHREHQQSRLIACVET